MPDLLKMQPLDIVRWLYDRKHDAPDVWALASRGITDTFTIDRWISVVLDEVYGTRFVHVVADLPDDSKLTPGDLPTLAAIGAKAWADDNDNATAWAIVAERISALNDKLNAEHGRGLRPRGRHPHDLISKLLDANRGPVYANKFLAIADRNLAELDAYGFGISPAEYEDLVTAGVVSGAVEAYQHLGLSYSDIARYASESITPAMLMQAQAEGVNRADWEKTLAGLPPAWFETTDGQWHRDPDWRGWFEHGAFIKRNRYIHRPDARFTLADLRFLVEHGWTDRNTLGGPAGGHLGAIVKTVETTREIAAHGLTWEDLDIWAKELTVGKAPEYSGDHTRAPLVGHRRGGRVGEAELPGIYKMVAAGVKPSHLSTYRKAGCTSIEHVLLVIARGIDVPTMKRLLETHGRQPSRHHSTRVFDSLTELLTAHAKDQESTP